MTEVGEGLGGGADRYERSPPPAITPSAKRFSYQDGRGRNSLGSFNDLATRRVTTARFAEPLTPPLTVERNKSQYQQHGRSTSSPTLSFSPRPFYHMGLGSASPLTPVKRQFQSPYLISRRRTLAGGQSRFNQPQTDENVEPNADTDTKGDNPSGEGEHSTSTSEDKGEDQGDSDDNEGDDCDDDGGEDGGEVAEDHDELNDTTESFELIDVYEEDSTYDFKDETGDAFEDEISHALNDGTADAPQDEITDEFKDETPDGFQDEITDELKDETLDGFQDGLTDALKGNTTDGFKDETFDGFQNETTDGFKEETGDSFASPLRSPSIDNVLPSPGTGSVELVHESRERLIKRLNGLIQRISDLPDEDELGNDNHPSLGALHIQVYEMEKILPPSEDTKSSLSSLGSNKSTNGKAPRLVSLRGGNSLAPKESTEPPKFWGSHTITVPNWLGSRFSEALLAPSPILPDTQAQEPNETVKTASTVATVATVTTVAAVTTATDPATPKAHSPARTPSPSIRIEPPSEPVLVTKSTQTTDQDAARFSQIASETNKLTAQLEAVFKSLQARHEESAHLHYLLVERAEAAAGRILELEKDVVDLQEELGDNEGELKHLRLRMRAVETLCGEFVRCNAKRGGVIDPDLVESIETWKSDWAKLREKMAAKKNEKRKARRSDSGLGGMEIQEDSTTASTVTISSLGLNSPRFSRTGRESGTTTPTITTPIRTIYRRRQ